MHRVSTSIHSRQGCPRENGGGHLSYDFYDYIIGAYAIRPYFFLNLFSILLLLYYILYTIICILYYLFFCPNYTLHAKRYTLFVNKLSNIYPIPTGELVFDNFPILLSWHLYNFLRYDRLKQILLLRPYLILTKLRSK